ncbi:MAG: cytochrome oxidase [bacterium]|nr:cytochrome oxidase [bacterium]MCP4799644.1 cytochrome oxidase [bacterium]
MDVLKVTVFVSLLLAICGLVLFVSRVKQGDLEHSDRLSLLPLEEDEQTDSDDNCEPETNGS